MYPVGRAFSNIKKRLNFLISGWEENSESNKMVKSFYACEAYMGCWSVMEKIIRRVLINRIMIKCKVSFEEAKSKVKKLSSIKKIGNEWTKYDENNKHLKDIIGYDDYRYISEYGWNLRCELLHGEDYKSDSEYRSNAIELLKIIDRIRIRFKNECNYSGWKNIKTNL